MMRNTPASRLRATPWWALLLAPALVFALVSCGGEASDPSGATDDETDGDSDDDDDDSNASDDAYSTDRQDLEANAALDLTDGDVFFDLREGRAVEVDDPTGDEDWDLWFTGWEIRTNGGISGVGLGGGVEFPEAGYDTIDTDAIPPVIFQDAHASVFDDWYDYDGTTHALASFGYVYLIKDGDRVHKAQIVSYYGDVGGAPVSALYTIRHAELTPEGVGETITTEKINGTAGGLDADGDAGYYAFDDGKLSLTDGQAADSDAWDLRFFRFTVTLNGGVSGPGQRRGYVLDTADFDAVSFADVPADEKFKSDRVKNVVDQWARYDGASGRTLFKDAVWAIQSADGESWFRFYPLFVDGAGSRDYASIEFRFDPIR